MLLLDGIEYEVKTPKENTDDLVTYINDECANNNIKNSLGEVISIDDNTSNPLYMILFGMGYMTTILQKLVYNAGCSMSVAEASERQLLNLSDIAGIKRTTPTKTIIQGTVYSNLEDAGAVDCVITQDDTATIVIAGIEVVFHPAFDVTIEPGYAKQIVLIAEDYGAYNISANTIIEFDEPIPGFRKMTTFESTPGQAEESIASLRARLQRRTVEGTQTDRAAAAIRDLEGVAMCNIYFNYSPQEAETIGSASRPIVVAPRTAALIVQGYSNDIAKVFYRYLFCPTSGEDVEGAMVQNYITHSGQELPVVIIPPVLVPVYIKIYIKNSLSYEQVDGIRDVICSLAGNLTIGKSITSTEITNIVEDAFSNLTVQGAEVSLDEEHYSYIQTPESDAVFVFNVNNIDVQEV